MCFRLCRFFSSHSGPKLEERARAPLRADLIRAEATTVGASALASHVCFHLHVLTKVKGQRLESLEGQRRTVLDAQRSRKCVFTELDLVAGDSRSVCACVRKMLKNRGGVALGRSPREGERSLSRTPLRFPSRANY